MVRFKMMKPLRGENDLKQIQHELVAELRIWKKYKSVKPYHFLKGENKGI